MVALQNYYAGIRRPGLNVTQSLRVCSAHFATGSPFHMFRALLWLRRNLGSVDSLLSIHLLSVQLLLSIRRPLIKPAVASLTLTQNYNYYAATVIS